MFTSLKRIVRSGWLNLRRHGALTFATCSIMVMTISLITLLFFLQGLTKFLISEIENKVDISVYFKKDSPEEEILKVREKLEKNPEVKAIDYISREEALKRFTEKYKDNPVLMESLAEIGENPLLASLNIKAFQANQYESIANFLEQDSFQNLIEKIDYRQNKEIIEKISRVSWNIKTAGVIFSLILAFIAILVAFNTIRLAIYSSREEIAIMKLVGASNWFIRGPFLVQGIIIGFAAVLFTLFIFIIAIFFLSQKIEAFLPGFNLLNYFTKNFWTLLLIQLVAGIGLGIISSFIAIRKYLEV